MTTEADRTTLGRLYARALDVLWRLAADRVVVRPVGNRSPDAPAEIAGSAAVVWMALVVPRNRTELRTELKAAGCADPVTEVEVALSLLVGQGLIEEQA